MVDPETLTGGLIALTVALSTARILWWQYRALPGARSRGWRVAVLIVLQLGAAVLLYRTLFPPRLGVPGETMVVVTANAPRAVRAAEGERLVALPEAGEVAASVRVPDLATALRQYPQTARMRIVGDGLVPRDRDGPFAVPIAVAAPPAPRGLIRLQAPTRTAAGTSFAVSGAVSRVPGARVELIDPAGRRVDARRVARDGAFVLSGTTRVPGTALFTLRLRDAAGAEVSHTTVPLWTVEEKPVRVLLIGAPGPEIKYLRRWIADAGMALHSQLSAGGGVQLGDAPIPITAATLRRFDLAIIDDRSWAGLGGARGAVAGAVRGGMGLVVTMSGPATPDARRQWRALGLAVEGGTTTKPVMLLPLGVDADALRARIGPGTPDADAALNTADDPAPELNRWAVTFAPLLVPMLADASGAPLAAWRTNGRGRALLWTVPDSFALVLGGQRERYYQWWSQAVATVARGEARFAPELPPIIRVGERMAICGIKGRTRVQAPGGAVTALLIDPPETVPGCAAYWPEQAGFHQLVQRSGNIDQRHPFYVYPADALAAAKRFELREATARIAASPPVASPIDVPPGERGPGWPWFLGWLLVSAALWAFERMRVGRARPALTFQPDTRPPGEIDDILPRDPA